MQGKNDCALYLCMWRRALVYSEARTTLSKVLPKDRPIYLSKTTRLCQSIKDVNLKLKLNARVKSMHLFSIQWKQVKDQIFVLKNYQNLKSLLILTGSSKLKHLSTWSPIYNRSIAYWRTTILNITEYGCKLSETLVSWHKEINYNFLSEVNTPTIFFSS